MDAARDLEELYRRVRAVGRHDTGARLFGANMHGWKVFRLSPEEQAEAEARHQLSLPDAYRWWISDGPGAGVGPFYGLLHPLDTERAEGELDGAIPLSDHGCGYADYLYTRGERAGQVWVDFREADGPLVTWYPSFERWLDAWLTRAFAEWGLEYLTATAPKDADERFLTEVDEAMARIDAGVDDPMLAQYPLPADKLRIARGRRHLHAQRFDEARAAFDAAAAVSREPDAVRALGECEIASATSDHAALLSAADTGLLAQPLWWISEKQLLLHRVHALEGLARWSEAFEARVKSAKHDPNDVKQQLDLVWINVLRKDIDAAADHLLATAQRGTGCDRNAPLATRIEYLSAGLLDALRAEDMRDQAQQLEAALATRVAHA